MVCLGDLIDRGPDSAGLISLVRSDPRIICIKGNHEQMAIQSITAEGNVELWQPWLQRGGKSTWVARKGNWKLYANPYDTSRRDYTYSEKFVLFDLENDPGESINLYDQETAVVNELKSLYKRWKSQQ